MCLKDHLESKQKYKDDIARQMWHKGQTHPAKEKVEQMWNTAYI